MRFEDGFKGLEVYVKGESHGYFYDGVWIITACDKSDSTFSLMSIDGRFSDHWTIPSICKPHIVGGNGWQTI